MAQMLEKGDPLALEHRVRAVAAGDHARDLAEGDRIGRQAQRRELDEPMVEFGRK